MGEAVPLQSHGVSFVFSEMRLGIPIPMLLILKGRVFPEQSHGKCKAYAGQEKQFPLGRTLRTVGPVASRRGPHPSSCQNVS